MNYKDKIYKKYVSAHTVHLYGEETLSGISKQFPAWDKYFKVFLPDDKSAKIVDLGCGNGGFVYWLQDCGYLGAVGVDRSAEQVACAKKLGIKNIMEASLCDFIKDKANFYDVIFLRDVLEHFKKNEIFDILEMINKALKNGGRVVIQTPNGQNIFSGRLRYGDFTHEVSFTKDSLEQVLSTVNFSEIEAFPMPPVIHGIKSFFRLTLWKITMIILKLYLLIENGSFSGILTSNIIVSAKK